MKGIDVSFTCLQFSRIIEKDLLQYSYFNQTETFLTIFKYAKIGIPTILYDGNFIFE